MFRWICLAILALALIGSRPAQAQHQAQPQTEPGWIDLLTDPQLRNWQAPHGQWQFVSSVSVRADNERLLTGEGNTGPILYNGPTGITPNLVTFEKYGDLALHAEFYIPKGSNSGIKFLGTYEIQIYDSLNVKNPTAGDCGGVYPRAELLPAYHHIDEGYPPLINASLAPGTWQTLDAVFRAPLLDEQGRKISNARFESIVLNGKTIHSDLEMPFATGHAWRRPEQTEGPILLQGDHGPCAFRNLKIKRLEPAATAPSGTSEINKQFLDPKLDPKTFVDRFETESREIFIQREKIASLIQAKRGQSIADIGSGTGLFTRIFADQVGPSGVVYAIDVSRGLLAHIGDTAKQAGQNQIKTVLSREDSILMPKESLDAAFLCDTYHHVENYQKALASIHRALRPGGRLILVEYDRQEGKSSEFILKHIRADQNTFRKEIEQAGFQAEPVESPPTLQENFVAIFRKVDQPKPSEAPGQTPQPAK